MSQLVVTEDMRIALADDIIDRTARLATISADAQPERYAMARTSLDARLQRYVVWTTAAPSAVATRPPPCLAPALVRHLEFLLARVLVVQVFGLLPWLLLLMRVMKGDRPISIVLGMIPLRLFLFLLM
jgi:hypothetical protein